ncbi:hypothetical protein C2G38_2244038 [Gigaspora rosea]|uniref:Uncharacterized protein n=1 Tax=Gigaspora rosea TaxID=44941 RepID=A0A397VMZ0_9GLOM|nr:hypothetical protein C2G38_2244038 [Gigaspora rosea]
MVEIQESEIVPLYITTQINQQLKCLSLTPKFTQKSRNNTPQYPIPDSYIVETEVSERSLKCETKYISNSKKINQKLLTKRFGPCLFGFDIEPLYHARLQISSQPVTTIKNNKHKKPLEDITSRSQQYKQLNSLKRIYKKLDAIVRVYDEELLDCEGYRSLAAIVPTFFFSIDSSEYTSDILVNNSEIGNGTFRDSRNVERKQNHVIVTFCLLNEGDNVLKPDHQFSLCLYIGKEDYEVLAKVGKFTYLIMGQNALNSEYFCLFCECNAKSCYNMDLSWPPTGNTKEKKLALFPVIDLLNYIPDELHLLLRISDVLIECLFKDLFKKIDFE